MLKRYSMKIIECIQKQTTFARLKLMALPRWACTFFLSVLCIFATKILHAITRYGAILAIADSQPVCVPASL